MSWWQRSSEEFQRLDIKMPVKMAKWLTQFSLASYALTLSDWVTHICISKITTVGSDNGLAPGRRQTIIWTNDGILLIGPLGTNFSEFLIGIQTFSFKKMHLKMSSKWRPFCFGLNVDDAMDK